MIRNLIFPDKSKWSPIIGVTRSRTMLASSSKSASSLTSSGLPSASCQERLTLHMTDYFVRTKRKTSTRITSTTKKKRRWSISLTLSWATLPDNRVLRPSPGSTSPTALSAYSSSWSFSRCSSATVSSVSQSPVSLSMFSSSLRPSQGRRSVA